MAAGRRRGRAFIYIALILILLLVLVFAVLQLNLFGTTPAAEAGTVPNGVTPVAEVQQIEEESVENIVVTTQDVRRGQVLSDDLLAVVPIEGEEFADGTYYTDKNQVVGSKAKFDMKAHTPVNELLIVEVGMTGDLMSFEIPAGQVAISVPVSKLSSISYALQKGDRVNVIASLLLIDLDPSFGTSLPNRTGVVIAPGPIDETQTNVTASWKGPSVYDGPATLDSPSYLGRVELDPSTNNPVFVVPSEPQRPRLVSQTLIQDALVLQVGTYKTEAEAPAELNPEEIQPTQEAGVEPQPVVETSLPDVITLAVDPQDAISLNYLMLSGASLNMVMRSAGDTTRVDTEAATLQFVLDQYRIPNPAKLPYGQTQRFDLSGQTPSYEDGFPSSIQPFPDTIPAPESTTQDTGQ